jgi:hypothetical protein
MTYRPGESGNPKGRPKGTFKRDSALVLRVLKDRNDTDPLALLSTIVTCAEAPLELRVQAAGMLAPYRHARCSTRYISRKIKLPEVETVEQATACIARISTLAAAGKLGLDEANDLIGHQKSFIEARIGCDLEQRVLAIEAALQSANIALPGVTVTGGLPPLPLGPGDGRLEMPRQIAAPADGLATCGQTVNGADGDSGEGAES